MKAKSAFLLLFFIYTIFFYSCKKEEFSIEPSSVYYKSSKEKVGDFRVFSLNGEIKDQAILNRFYYRDSSMLRYLSDDLFPERRRFDTIYFADLNNAKVLDDNSYTDYSVTQEKSSFLLLSKQIFQYTYYGDVFTKSPAYLICQYKPPVYAEYISSSTGGNYLFGFDFKKASVLTSKNGVLKAPWIVMISYYNAGYYNNYTVQNKPDYNFYKFLNTGDTVILQEYLINYTKR